MHHFKSVPLYVCYYYNLHMITVINDIRYRFQHKPIIYAIRHRATGMMYIGSTFTPSLRFHQHLISGTSSNANLQAAMALHGQSKFVLYVLELVQIPNGLSRDQRKLYLLGREQHYMDRYSTDQLYNSSRAIAK